MATLADLFNQKSDSIYKKFSPDRDQLVSITPTSKGILARTKSIMRYDSRALPLSSTIRDAARIAKYSISPQGLLNLAKQILLQTGNTFENTGAYNPLSILINTVPFIHSRRAIKQDPHLYLQSETITKLVTRRFSLGLPDISNKDIRNNIGNLQDFSRPEYQVFYRVNNSTGPRLFAQQIVLERGNIKEVYTPLTPDQNQYSPTDFVQAAKDFKKKFDEAGALKEKLISSGRNNRLRSSYINDRALQRSDSDDNEDPTSINTTSAGVTNYYDEYNHLQTSVRNLQTPEDKIDYSNIIKDSTTLADEGKTDIIKFIFSEVGGTNVNPVQFRAFLSSIKESIKTEFSDQRYVGRTERFVTYGGAKRNVSLQFNIAAFSQFELEGMWSRVNYLSGLAFPKTVTNGFMVPPLFNITVGGIYDNQPCYIESLDFNFLDDSSTFDIENEVPFVITVNMQLSLLEKRSRFHNSPFYKITEDILQNQLTRLSNKVNATVPTTMTARVTPTAPIAPPNVRPTTITPPVESDKIYRMLELETLGVPREMITDEMLSP